MDNNFHFLFPKYRNCEGLNIPSSFTSDEIRKLLYYIKNSNTLNQKRNYAMAVLMVSYGFRTSDIMKLELVDINWEASSITFTQSKTKGLITHGLTPEAGNSLIYYLLEERPETSCQRVFVKRDGHAIGSSSTVSNIISNFFITSSINIGKRRHGSHSLRHSLASAMIKDGIGIFEISKVLGHSCVDTSRIYTKIDIESLKLCELEVPCYE